MRLENLGKQVGDQMLVRFKGRVSGTTDNIQQTRSPIM